MNNEQHQFKNWALRDTASDRLKLWGHSIHHYSLLSDTQPICESIGVLCCQVLVDWFYVVIYDVELCQIVFEKQSRLHLVIWLHHTLETGYCWAIVQRAGSLVMEALFGNPHLMKDFQELL